MTQTKRIGIIGPTSVPLVEETLGLSAGALESAAGEMGAFLAEHSFGIVCVPIKGVALWAIQAYKEAGGVNSLALWPRSSEGLEDSTDTSRSKPELADQVKDDLTWRDAPFELAKACDCLVVIGLSCGTIIEIAVTKWMKRKPVFVLSPLMTRIPLEIACELDLRYYNDTAALKRGIADFLC